MTRPYAQSSTLLLLLLVGCSPAPEGHGAAGATTDEPAATSTLAACQGYATSHYQRVSPERFASLQLLEEESKEEKYGDRVGSQLVSTVLKGRGIWQNKTDGPSNIRFTCLLENPAEPIFVDVVEEGPRDPVQVCWDGFEPSGWDKMTECLGAALKREEAALANELTKAGQQAGSSLDKASAEHTLQESNAQWVEYRDSECARRLASVAGRNHPDIGELTCLIRKTAERSSDLRFDESL